MDNCKGNVRTLWICKDILECDDLDMEFSKRLTELVENPKKEKWKSCRVESRIYVIISGIF